MKRNNLAAALLVLSLLISFSTTEAAEEKLEVLCTSPSGAFRVEMTGEAFSSGEEPSGDVWVISTADPAQRAKLPKQSSDSPLDDEVHFSPNEEWIFGLRHVGSGLRYGNVYHLARPLKIDKPINREFNDVVWENCVKLGALNHDYSAEGVYAMTFFVAWSLDSSRLLIRLYGGEEKRSMKPGLLYFNTRSKKFEVTDYLWKLNKTKSEALACAEPVDALPVEAELKGRLDTLDRQLNAKYLEVIAKAEKDRVPNVREAERNWIKHRDEGAKFYMSIFPAAEKERRRLQFLGDVTAARIDMPAEDWESE
jgi:uncharacterized protein YecT (DUF1311 family)